MILNEILSLIRNSRIFFKGPTGTKRDKGNPGSQGLKGEIGYQGFREIKERRVILDHKDQQD